MMLNGYMVCSVPFGGFRRVPLALTLGHGGATTAGTGSTVVVQHLPRSAQRVRLHLVNRNPRYVKADSPAVSISGAAIGVHDGAGRSARWTELPHAGKTPYVSGWVEACDACRGNDIAIRYTWSAAGPVQRNIGTGWTDGRRDDRPPLFAWLEVDVPASTLVVAAFGDSLSCGVSSSRPVVDSWVGQWARENDAVPMHLSHSGDKAIGWPAAAERKWGMYGSGVAVPDALVYFMGSNGLAESAPSAWEMQRRILFNVAEIRSRLTANIYAATILPRTKAAPGSRFEVVRREVNAWLPRSGLFRDVFPFAAAISSDDKTILPPYDADGVHLTSAGYGALAGVVDRPAVHHAEGGAVESVRLRPKLSPAG